jgi:hypothetical protein
MVKYCCVRQCMKWLPNKLRDYYRNVNEAFSANYLVLLDVEASQSPRARKHRNIHERYDEHC